MDSVFLEVLERNLPQGDTGIARDLKLNLKRLLTESALEEKERLFALLTLAVSLRSKRLEEFATLALQKAGAQPEEIGEAREAAALMQMLNTYYRFKHLLGEEKMSEYGAAGLRMTSLARPVLGKLQFEMLAFAISVLNACPSCINSHEAVLRQGGVSVGKIHDLARLASVLGGISQLEHMS